MIYTIIIKYFNYSCQRIEVLSMSFIKKHKVIFIILLFLILIGLTLFLSIKIFQYNHPTHYKFNDRFIIGNTIENIEAEYGPLEFEGYTLDGLKIGRYLAEKGTANFGAQVMGYSDSDVYYYIFFDNAGIAEKIRLIRIA